jgi:hypothetical protein
MIFFGSIVSALAQKNNAPNTFILDAKMLEVAKKRINKNDETVMPAYQQLIKNADKALKLSPFTVTAKKDPAPATDIHDYVSIAPYWFPDPTKPDGLPYIRKDGERNPEVSNYPDKEALPKMTSAVESLALAYYFSEDEKYADKAATLIRVFFLDAATRMNPNLNYAQAIKGRNDGRGAGIIESRHFVKVIDGIGLIQKSKSWTSKDQAGIEKWFADMLDWMQTSKNGIDELNAKNNHGVFYDMQRMSFALLTKNTDLQKEIIENVTSRLDNQQADDGSFPAELERTIGLHYSTFVLKAFYALAFMAEQIHVDLWNYTSPSGKSLKKATEFWYPYATNQAEWKWQQINPYEYENECIDVLKIASIKYNDDKYVKNIDKLIDASVVKKHLSNLIVGMDLR